MHCMFLKCEGCDYEIVLSWYPECLRLGSHFFSTNRFTSIIITFRVNSDPSPQKLKEESNKKKTDNSETRTSNQKSAHIHYFDLLYFFLSSLLFDLSSCLFLSQPLLSLFLFLRELLSPPLFSSFFRQDSGDPSDL